MSKRFEDERGVIEDLLTKRKIRAVTRIVTMKGAVRGNHIHHKTTQWTYVVSGRLLAVHADPQSGGITLHQVFRAGSLIEEPPGVPHAWKAQTTCVVLVFSEGPRSGEDYESDTTRLPASERLL